MKRVASYILRALQVLLLPAILIGIWHLFTRAQIVERVFLPSPAEVSNAFGNLIIKGEVFPDFLATMRRAILAFLLSACVGVPIGLFLGYFRRAYSLSEFLLDFLRSIPATAIFPLFLLIFSVGDASKIAMATFSCVFVIIINTIYGAWSVPTTRIVMARTFRASDAQILVKIILFDALPSIFSGLRNALSIALILTVVSEMFVGTSKGLGFAIYNAKIIYDTPTMYALIILLGAIGFVSNKLLLLCENRMLPWIKNRQNQ